MEDAIPLDYKSVFGRTAHPPESIPSWHRFWDFAHKDESLSRFWGIGSHTEEKWYSPAIPDLAEVHSRRLVYGTIEKLVDRYIHVSGQKEDFLGKTSTADTIDRGSSVVRRSNKLAVNGFLPCFSREKEEVEMPSSLARVRWESPSSTWCLLTSFDALEESLLLTPVFTKVFTRHNLEATL